MYIYSQRSKSHKSRRSRRYTVNTTYEECAMQLRDIPISKLIAEPNRDVYSASKCDKVFVDIRESHF